jgi:CRP/FNR family transcriptional regulator, cyclic AMP receptor protein
MKTIADILKEHTFFEGLSPEDLTFIAGCGKNVHFQEGEIIAKPGDPANEFYLIREGNVALSIEAPPRKPFIYQTLGENELVGLAWLIPPYRWTATAKAQSHLRAISIDGACLREKCEKEPSLGFKLMKHLVQVLVKREEASRLHLLDIYGEQK